MGILKQTNKYKGKTNIPNSKVNKRKGADHKTDKKCHQLTERGVNNNLIPDLVQAFPVKMGCLQLN